MKKVLETKKLCKNFGGLKAMDSIDMDIAEREIVALIGPNGAGKTTFFNCITGMYPPTSGAVLVNPPGKPEKSLKKLKPNKVTELGLARTFQNILTWDQNHCIVGGSLRFTIERGCVHLSLHFYNTFQNEHFKGFH